MAVVLYPPLVKFTKHPLKWTHNKVVMLAGGITLGHIGLFIVAALYFLITQAKYPIGHGVSLKHWWDTSVTPSSLRHDIRDLGEGTLAACMAGAIMYNPFKKSNLKSGRILGLIKSKLHLPLVLSALITAAIFWTASYEALTHIFTALKVHTPSHNITGSVWNRTVDSLWKSSWDKKLIGFACTFIARKPLRIVFDEAQLFFVNRRVLANRAPRFYHPPAFKARYNMLATNDHQQRSYSKAVGVVMGLAVPFCLALAGYGYYVLTYIK